LNSSRPSKNQGLEETKKSLKREKEKRYLALIFSEGV
jgi:hypothetical protein